MVQTQQKTIEDYADRLKRHLLKKYPHLEIHVVKWSDEEVTLLYSPYSEIDEWPIIQRAGGIATDALVDHGFRIHVMPNA